MSTTTTTTPKKERERKPQASADGTSSTLVFRNLPSTTTSADFSTFVSSLAPIQHAFVVTKKTDSGIQCEGYGFVTFTEKPDAINLVNNPPKYNSHTVTVAYAKPRQRRQPEEPKPKRVQLSKDPSLPTLRPRLIFRNLSWKVRTQAQLERFVRVYGTPKEIRIPRGKGGRMTGFAFVEMKTRKAAGKVIDALNGMNLDGREVAVDWCVSKDEWTQHQRQESAREDPLDEDEEEDVEDNVKTEDEDEDDGILEENSNSDAEDDNSDDDDELREPTSQTIFIRNIPYLVTRATLVDLFRPLGHISSLYLVVDPTTSLSRGTAFLTFASPSPAQHLLSLTQRISSNIATAEEIAQYTLEGRVLDFLPAVNRDEATRLKDEHASKKRDDKRNLYLLKEGDIDSRHPFYAGLSPMDVSLRKDSIKQRKDMLASNPSLHLSLTRLAVRNIPRTVEEHEFKALAIQAITEFDEEVTKELRSGLTEEELARDETGVRKGRLVRQAKIVLEKTGRSKGYGFIEYNTHANALKGLRWLNARVVGVRKVEAEGDRKRRLLVEFAIENAQVVKRRRDREEASRRKAATTKQVSKEKRKEKRKAARDVVEADNEETGTKRKRVGGDEGKGSKKAKTEKDGDVNVGATEVGKIIAAKRFRKKLERGKKEK